MELSLPDDAVSGWLFGKLPSHGDFIARGLDAASRDALDTWLTAEMAEARTLAGDDFDRNYAEMPVWQFVEPRGDQWSGGAFCASVDKVGRRFPILAACSVEADAAIPAAIACEQCIYDGFEAGWDADALLAALDALVIEAGEIAPEAAWWTEGGERFPPKRIMGIRPESLFTRMLEGECA